MVRVRALGLVCLLVWCSALFGEEDFERMLEMYRQSGYANVEQRLREYEALQEMRRERGLRHLPAGSRFDFARESFRRMRSEAPGVTGANGCAWTSAGPTNLNGRVISIAIDPNDNQKIYAATVGGLWRSSTAGRRWERVSDDLLSMRFSAIAVNPGASNDILAGSGDRNMGVGETGNGLWRSDNYGAPGSWTKATNKFDSRTVYRIRYDPAPPHNVYVAATNGIWLGTYSFGGAVLTFNRIDGFDAVAHDMAIDFSTTPPKIYAGVRENSPTVFPALPAFTVGIYKWDSVNHWQKKDSGIDLSDAETFSLALSQSDPSILYARVSQRSDGTMVGIYKSTNSADSWDMLPLGTENKGVPDEIMGWYNTMFEVDPTDPDRVYSGAIDMWMSVDGGKEWEPVAGGKDPDHPLPAHADFHALAFDPDNPKIIYVGNDGGIDRSSDVSQTKWHWTDVSHGMIISMFYFLTSNRQYPTLLAGGLQDNGTAITFGNRTWYQPGGGDGFDVGSDAGNPDTLYAREGIENLYELVNPVPGTEGGPNPPGPSATTKLIVWDNPKPKPPLVTDVLLPHAAIAGGGGTCGPKTLLQTTDGMNWTDMNPSFPPGGAAIALAIAPSSTFKTYLAAVAYRPPTHPRCHFNGVTFSPYVIRTDDGGSTPWTMATGLPVNREPSSLAFDPNDPSRSYVTYWWGFHGIYMSTGGAYSNIAAGLAQGVRRVVVDPFDTNVLYAATSVGMFRGEVTLGMSPTATWAPFDEGLPDGLEINDLWVDPQTGILTMGSYGFGAFRRDIRKVALCKPSMLVVRDCVNDDGQEPSPCDVPDPEHPIKETELGREEFYKPDDTVAGKAWWWTSRDIRIDVPSKNPPANQLDDVDSVEFELCPSSVSACLPQSMIDSSPIANKEARIYVQVTNRGVVRVGKTRVIALWMPAGGVFDYLPETFWTKTFPANGPCGALDPGTAWKLVDSVNPCQTIDSVTPELPELARFDWITPDKADGGPTILTIVESDDDPLDPSIRLENKLDPSEIVPGSRHMALRNVHIKPFRVPEIHIPKMWPIDILHLPQTMSEVEVVISKPDLRDAVRIVLPAGLTAHEGVGSVRRTRVTEAELVRQLDSMRLDPNNAWEISGDEASLFLDLRSGERVTTAMIATPEHEDSTSRVSIVERSRGSVIGGSVMLLRPEMQER